MDEIPTIEREGDKNSLVAHSVGQAFIWKRVEKQAKTYLDDARIVEKLVEEEGIISPHDKEKTDDEDKDYALSLQMQWEEEDRETTDREIKIKNKREISDDEAIAKALQAYEEENKEDKTKKAQNIDDDTSLALALQLQDEEENSTQVGSINNFTSINKSFTGNSNSNSLRLSGEFASPEAYAMYLSGIFAD